jgi:hypothetical protein
MVWFPAEVVDFSLHHSIQTGSGAHPASCIIGTRGCFPRGEMTETCSQNSPLSSAKAKNGRAVPPLSHQHVMVLKWVSTGMTLYSFFSISCIKLSKQWKEDLILMHVGWYVWQKWRVLVQNIRSISTLVTICLSHNTVLLLIYTCYDSLLHTH